LSNIPELILIVFSDMTLTIELCYLSSKLLVKGNDICLKEMAFLPAVLPSCHIRHTPLKSNKYEGWNFNSGNYLFTTDTK